MEQRSDSADRDDLREEYDFSGGARGTYAKRYADGANIVVLDPDIARVFRSSESVNKALRALVEVANEATTGPSRR